jgi:YidC/Oxa1 family membrane protein insertase
MKNKFVKVFVILLMVISLSGCTKVLKDSKNKVVTYDSKIICDSCNKECKQNLTLYNELKEKKELTDEEKSILEELEVSTKTCDSDCKKKCELAKENSTGQTLTANILCRPTNKDVIEIYKINNMNLDKLAECNNFSINEGGYEGLWTSIFVKPLAWIVLKVGTLIKNYGLALIIISFLIRLCMMPLTKSTAMQSENMKKAQPEISSLESKYKGKTDQDSMMKKSQETMQIYKKYGINPLSSCLFAILQIPLLFAFIEAINRTPALFEGSFLGLKLGMTPSVALTRGEWWYLLIVVIIAAVTYFSFTLNKSAAATPETQKQMNMMNKILIVFIVFMSFSLSTAIGIYWITSSSFTIFQNLLVHRSDKK